MAYFVTGGTGFIGRFLIGNLLKRGDPIYVLVRKGSQKKLAGLRQEWGASEAQVIAVTGDLGKPLLGVAEGEIAKLKGKVKHMFHLAAIFDLAASAEAQERANIDGTRHAIDFAAAVQAGCFPHLSSLPPAGPLPGAGPGGSFQGAAETRTSAIKRQTPPRRVG